MERTEGGDMSDNFFRTVEQRQAAIDAARNMVQRGHLVDKDRDAYTVLGSDFRALEEALWALDEDG